MTDNVKVAIRCRPLSLKEISEGYESVVDFEGNSRLIVKGIGGQSVSTSADRRSFSRTYDFDAVFDQNATQEIVYKTVCQPIVDSVLEGYNGTIFAYGQTGTGKTYTMEGASMKNLLNSKLRASQETKSSDGRRQSKPDIDRRSMSTCIVDEPGDKASLGIIQRASRHIFEHIQNHQEIQFLIRVSYLEIYQEEIHDLLRKDTKSTKLELHERPDIGVYVKGLTSFVCKSIIEIERVMKVGNQNRRVGATDMNEHSSRSHAIFIITVEQQIKEKEFEGGSTLKKANQSQIIKVGKLNLIDLAGSERQRKTNSLGRRQRESVKINLSLSALGNVINSLMKMNTHDQKSDSSNPIHTPYRDSKLTRLLQDSLGGNAKTLMIANIGPASYNYDETINTLNYASRAKFIRNRPRLNEDPKDALLRQLQREIEDLRRKLSEADQDGTKASGSKRKISTESAKLTKSTSKRLLSEGNIENNENQISQELQILRQKLKSLEGKLLNSYNIEEKDQKVLDHSKVLQGYTAKQEQELEARKFELANQEDRERAIRDELEKREEMELLTKESFSSIQQELETKKRLIRQILIKIKTMRDVIETNQAAHRVELDELDQLQYVLTKELKLKCLIMDNFIPNQHVNQLLPRINLNDKTNNCTIRPIELAIRRDSCMTYELGSKEAKEASEAHGSDFECISYEDFWNAINKVDDMDPNVEPTFRPKSEFERIEETIFPANIRFKYEEFIEHKVEFHKPDLENRIFGDRNETFNLGKSQDNYKNVHSSSQQLQEFLEEALDQHEPDITV